MNRIPTYTQTCPTGTSLTSLCLVEKYDQLLVHVPRVAGFAGSSPVAITLRGTPNSSLSSHQMNYWDYVNKTPASCVITISTGGIYEFPYPGSLSQVQIQFDTNVTSVTDVTLIAPRTTF